MQELFLLCFEALRSGMSDSGGQFKGTEGPFLCVKVSSSFASGCFDPVCMACWSRLKAE